MFQVRLLHISFYQVPSSVCGTGQWAAHWSSFQSFSAGGWNGSGEGTYNRFQFSFPKEVGTDCDWQRLTKFQTFTTPEWTANLTGSPRPEAVFSLPVKGIFRGILRGLSYLGKYSKDKEGLDQSYWELVCSCTSGLGSAAWGLAGLFPWWKGAGAEPGSVGKSHLDELSIYISYIMAGPGEGQGRLCWQSSQPGPLFCQENRVNGFKRSSQNLKGVKKQSPSLASVNSSHPRKMVMNKIHFYRLWYCYFPKYPLSQRCQ